MSNFAVLILCLVAGILLKFWNRLPKATPEVLNGFILHISLPALVLSQFHQVALRKEILMPTSMPWIIFFLGWAVFVGLGKMLGWSQKTVGALILTGGLGNTAFVGYPVTEALFGTEALKTAVLVDQLGSFPALSILGIGIASVYSTRSVKPSQILKRIFAFPPTYALLAAIILMRVEYPGFIMETLRKLGSTIAPLALVSVGFQLNLDWQVIKKHGTELGFGLLYKLILAPVFMALLLSGVFHASGLALRVTLIQAAMAPMITSAIISSEYHLNSELANLMVGLGIPLSFVTVPIWAYVLEGFGF